MKSIKKFVIASGAAMGVLLANASTFMAQALDVEPINPGTGYATNFGTMFNSVLNIVMLVAAILVFVYLIIGGISWLTSGGDKGKAEKAREQITAAIIGLVIIAASYALFNLILNFLGFSNLNNVFENVQTINGSQSI
ncbi:MAG TPA: hypothetical protein PLQ50_00985 [Candidatus Woesebacteria bacterium]|jgi:hypothetical protein|nr:hypothetical protein [Candidatus Woesebacteria bacterium]